MQLRTDFDLVNAHEKIDYQSKTMFLGSCFTDNVGEKFTQKKLQVDVNSFGVLYNPFSVGKALQLLIDSKEFKENDLHFHNDLWYSFYHHSKFSDTNKLQVLNNINEKIQTSSVFLLNSNYVFLTFGTAWIYKLKETDDIVSNCHKLPAKLFERELLSVSEIVEYYRELLSKLFQLIPKINVVLTVSPVRHLKDGVVENQVSKSTLLLAVNELVEEFEHVNYFPSYEIMMDDLRDYRFYAEDMVHPNNVAIDYIWEKFCNVYFDESSFELMKEIDKIVKAKSHKPFNPRTKLHQQFLIKQVNKIEEINKRFPFIDFAEELEYFTKSII